ncbi:DUF6226 family protein [Nesterenkonia sp. PF2B19]|uniref:DUF6226 family protein n=1 Tax=unclassified Nesterenkonia TaxID=2629769 RepID=UPI000872ECDA|nr:DUF6226 family protein [Nesterenkonia sp. PF2B19]OSM42993.1 hypothetical protein BCY76_011215 [Nesterenkonia sp. PF2B19]
MSGPGLTRDDVRAAVEAEYRADPLSEISWDDQYPQRLLPGGGSEPPEDAYSRVSEPERYRIVGARARAWERALERLGLGDAVPTIAPTTAPATVPTAVLTAVPASWTFRPEQPQVRLIVPRRSDAQPLVLVTGALEGVGETVVAVGMGDARGGSEPVLLGWEPDRGCDACDSGSADLLAAVDQEILTVVGGAVHVSGGGGRRRWVAWTTPGGHRASGRRIPRDVDGILTDARAGRVRRGWQVLCGESWWGGSVG